MASSSGARSVNDSWGFNRTIEDHASRQEFVQGATSGFGRTAAVAGAAFVLTRMLVNRRGRRR